MSEESPAQGQPPAIDAECMTWLRLWHERLAHANLKAIVTLAHQGDAGKTPDALPKGPKDKFEGLQPYIDELNCEACREVYGNPSGPSSW